MRGLSKNLTKISLSIKGQYKNIAKKIPTYLLGFVGPCDRKHTYFLANNDITLITLF